MSLTVIFGFVGLVFLLFSADILRFFNMVSARLGMQEGVAAGANLYVALAVSYMYLVTLLACLMYRNPQHREYPLILMNAKLASAAISAGLFVAVQPLLIYLVNGVVDGSIGVLAAMMYSRAKKG